jgi:hypothetical protein
MNDTKLARPLVAGYLKEFDAAASVLPVPRARELREQVVTHIGEAVGPEAGDEEVAAVLAGLGSPRVLVAEAAATVGKRSWAARFGWKGWLAVAAITIAIALPSGTVLFWQAQPSLQFRYSFAWWNRIDGARAVTTYAAGATQDTVPIRPGKIQGFAIFVYNPSDLTQFIMGGVEPVSPGAGVPPQIAVSTTATWHQMGEPHAVSYRASGAIPPHSYRWVRVLWRSAHCYLAAGGSQGTSDLLLNVRVGWITRIEDISLGAEIAVAGTKASVQADRAYCQDQSPGS